MADEADDNNDYDNKVSLLERLVIYVILTGISCHFYRSNMSVLLLNH